MADDVVIIKPTNAIVEITAPGPQGPSASAQIFYVHTQAVPAAIWTIDHNLGGQPTAVVLDSAGTQCEGTFSYPSANQMVITFSSAFTGTAYII